MIKFRIKKITTDWRSDSTDNTTGGPPILLNLLSKTYLAAVNAIEYEINARKR
jgi:hypothetical protein